MPTFTLHEVAARVAGELIGDGSAAITGLESIDAAGPGQLTFIGSDAYAKRWPASGATAALVSRKIAHAIALVPGRSLILVNNADLAMAAALELFAPPPPVIEAGIHPTAVLHPTARLGTGVRVGAHCTIGPGVVIGDRCSLYPNVTLLDHATLGDDCVLWPGVVVRDRCAIGHRCILHPNVSIGADGFGYRPSADGKGLVKVPQIGTVEIGNDVEIGAGSCVDRAKFSATVIGDGCKIDNLCQIAHNCRLGRCVIIAGQVGIAGSATIGDGVMIGGHSAIGDHLTIGAGAVVVAFTAVMRDVEPGAKVAGAPAREARQFFRELSAMTKLPEVLRDMKRKE
jgi:UDP-3-O-[3-hydroxymyristoyl] glucosamine N-acyltransferase